MSRRLRLGTGEFIPNAKPQAALAVRRLQYNDFIAIKTAGAGVNMQHTANEPAARILNAAADEASRRAVTTDLQAAGLRVDEAAMSAEVLAAARTEPDLIVLDLRLQDAGGLEVCRRLKTDASTAAIPILVLAADCRDSRCRVACFEAGAEACLPMPAVADELVAQAQTLLRLRRAERHLQAQVDQALRESEQRMRSVSDNLPNGAVYQILGDDAGRRWFVYLSAGIERMLGVTPAEAMADANAVYGLVHEEDQPRLAALEVIARRDLSAFDCEFRTWTRRGELRWVHCRSAPRSIPSGETVWEGIVMDVTDRKRYEESLKEADRRKDEFLATLAHELRNPLAPLRNGLHLLRQASDNPALREQAQGIMERQVAQMVRLIDDLLDVGRITQGKLQLRCERVELASIVQSAIENSRPLIESHGHALSITLPPEAIFLDADPTRLAQVLANLLINATKYTDRGGRIWLSAERQNNQVHITVKDTGIGIAAEHLPKLFAMFSQAAPALERSQGGLGIGLALVKGLVAMHGGTVSAHSAGPGQGSEFVVRLPVLDAPPVQTPHARHGAAPTCARKRILVADDNRDAAESLALLLQAAGHEVHAVHDGQEAVEAAAWFHPDAALLDIGMPRLNGFEAARRIRQELWGQKMLLVAITGWGQEEDRRRAREAGFNEHLTKPVASGTLEKLLAEVKPNN
jgi:PAS domain S-box-containing protein